MEKLLPWLSLKSVPGIGNILFKRLIQRFQSPGCVFQAPVEDLCRVEGMTQRLARAIHRHRTPEGVRRDLDLAMGKGCRIVPQTHDLFPALLREIPDPPPFLYVQGRMDPGIRKIAIVGSRNATSYGLKTAMRLGADLADMDVTVVSGMALGIDTAAHEGALSTGKDTIAVLGSGLSRIYPAANRHLFDRITEHGAVVSEFPMMAPPEAHHFPMRNRIISGMSLGTVVVEASRRSGSLITARLAAEQNREVFAVPGSVQSFKSTGTHGLIKQGAKLVENALDILEEFSHVMAYDRNGRPDGRDGRTPADVSGLRLSGEERVVFDALGAYPVHIDDLVRQLDMGVGKLSAVLLRLELLGVIQQTPGKLFLKKE